jgi:hypothetical protein
MHIPIVEGRGFLATDSETSPKVAVVNQALVKQFFPGQNPVGKSFYGEGCDEKKISLEIVNVSADAAYDSLRNPPPPTFYVPHRQQDGAGGMTYQIRSHANVGSVVTGVFRAIQTIDHDLPLIDVRTQADQIDATMQEERIFATLTGGFGVLEMILAGVGTYGLMSYNVARRTNEIGVRMGLGDPMVALRHE